MPCIAAGPEQDQWSIFTFAMMTATPGAGQISMPQQHTLRDFAWLCIQLGLSVACRVMPSLVGHRALGTALALECCRATGHLAQQWVPLEEGLWPLAC